MLKVRVSYPDGFAVMEDLKRDMALLATSGRGLADRTRRLPARVPDLNVFSQGLVARESGGWKITDEGRAVLEFMEARPSASYAIDIAAAGRSGAAIPPLPLPAERARRRRERRERRREAADRARAAASKKAVEKVGKLRKNREASRPLGRLRGIFFLARRPDFSEPSGSGRCGAWASFHGAATTLPSAGTRSRKPCSRQPSKNCLRALLEGK